jgi:hypothetical protein
MTFETKVPDYFDKLIDNNRGHRDVGEK